MSLAFFNIQITIASYFLMFWYCYKTRPFHSSWVWSHWTHRCLHKGRAICCFRRHEHLRRKLLLIWRNSTQKVRNIKRRSFCRGRRHYSYIFHCFIKRSLDRLGRPCVITLILCTQFGLRLAVPWYFPQIYTLPQPMQFSSFFLSFNPCGSPFS